MGVYDKFSDGPEQIKKEGQEITVRFQRTGPTTGRVSWNIPPPTAGCGKDAPRAYDGFVVTLNTRPSNYLSNSPKNGTYYSGDPTADADLHAGDKLDGAIVIAALYHDLETTYVDINDVIPKTAYYVSGYAVDSQARYHREGVHAYSLPTGSEEWSLPDKASKHDIYIDVIGGIDGATETGLAIDVDYKLKVKINKKVYTISIAGEDATSYTDLVHELQEQLALLGDVFSSPIPPYANSLYYNTTTKELKLWNGTAHVDVAVLSHPADPTMQEMGALWFSPSTALLKIYDFTSWALTPYIETPSNPAELACDRTWFDGTNVWMYKLTHWDKLYTYIQSRNPLMAPSLTCDDYWYNRTDSTVSVWNVDTKKWDHVDVIYYGTDPNSLVDGNYWYDEKSGKVKELGSGVWSVKNGVTYVESLPSASAEYTTVAGGNSFVFATETHTLVQFVNGEWVDVSIVSFISDPMSRSKNKLWWNSTPNIDTLFAWDELGSTWVEVTSFTQSEINPSYPQEIENNSAWYNPETGEVKLMFKTSCKQIFPIFFNSPPGELPVGTVWHDTDDNKWYAWDGAVFGEIVPMYAESDPYAVIVGYYWFDESDSTLKLWNGSEWITTPYLVKPVEIPIGRYWFDTVNDQSFVWNGLSWDESIGIASVELIPAESETGRSILSFFTRDIGCASSVEIVTEPGDIITSLAQPVIYTSPMGGTTGLSGGVMFKQLGVGDDGSPDERRAMHNDIRSMLGHPTVQVELTKEQLDICINLALQELRKYSSYSVYRKVFFMDLMPNQQTYLLTNKCVGFNKVTNINSLHRSRGLAVSSASIDNDAFTYAAIQRLYTMGTFDMLSYHLVSSYMEEMETLFANRIMFNWQERERELGIYNRVTRKERVLVDAFIERTEQDLLVDRHTALWLQRWALAEAKMILSHGRGKFQSLPGPNGTTVLNNSDLKQEAQDEMTKLREQLEDGSMQNFTGIGLRAHLILG
jgi:hypothetical protein